jgi:ADP-ribosylglycohydrolase
MVLGNSKTARIHSHTQTHINSHTHSHSHAITLNMSEDHQDSRLGGLVDESAKSRSNSFSYLNALGLEESQSIECCRKRAIGAIMGVLIGDSLGMGCHWYYDLEDLKRDYGEWVNDYVDPKPGRYHGERLKRGELTQSGEVTSYLLNTLAACQEYDEDHFTQQWDVLLNTCDGTRTGGLHGWTNKDVCDVYQRRVNEGKPWGRETASPTCDTTDSICRAALLAALYYQDLPKMCDMIRRTTLLQYADVGVVGQSICFGCVIALLIRGEPLDETLSSTLYCLAQEGELPFAFLRGDRDGELDLYEPDGLLWLGQIAKAAKDSALGGQLEPHQAVQLYGLPCAWFMVLPSSYYLASRFANDFEKAVLSSVNAGGQNVARTSLVGALVGAHLGVDAIPNRFLSGLTKGEEFLEKATKVANRISDVKDL